MKRKLALGLSLIAMVVSSSGSAMEIYKGKLLSHKETATGKVKTLFKEMKFDLNKEVAKFKAKSISLLDGFDRVYIKDHMYDATGTTGYEIELAGVSHVFVVNKTDQPQVYTIKTYICADKDNCGYSTDQLSLDPEGFAMSVRKPSMMFTYGEAGQYYSAMATTVKRDSQETTFSSFDFASVEIFDEK